MMSLKKMSKCGRLNNEGMLNLDSVFSSISANTSSAITLSRNPFVPILPAVCESIAAINLFISRPFCGSSLISGLSRITVEMPTPAGRKATTQEPISQYLRKLLNHPWLLIMILAIIPSSLGGYPSIQCSDLIMHKFPDPISISIWELKSCYQATD